MASRCFSYSPNSLIYIIALVLLLQRVQCAEIPNIQKRTDADSYLDALKKSHNDGEISNRDDYSASYPSSSSYPDNSIGLSSGYEYSPSPEYGPPPTYGAPGIGSGPTYNIPPTMYGPPAAYPGFQPPFYGPSYGPPRPITYGYGPPRPTIIHSAPRDNWFLDKFKFKLDLFTIGKILLKLILFKKIIKFIALICLLLFLPKLQPKHMKMEDLVPDADGDDEDDDEEEDDDKKRSFASYYEPNKKKINEVTKFALTAIEAFTDKHLKICGNLTDIPCRFQSMVDQIDVKYPYEKIIEIYLPWDLQQSEQKILNATFNLNYEKNINGDSNDILKNTISDDDESIDGMEARQIIHKTAIGRRGTMPTIVASTVTVATTTATVAAAAAASPSLSSHNLSSSKNNNINNTNNSNKYNVTTKPA